MLPELPVTAVDVIRDALSEDIGNGDHTSMATVIDTMHVSARLLVKEPCVIAGIPVAVEVFRQVDKNLKVNIILQDGNLAHPGDIALTVEGKAISVLSAERTVLNFMQRLSGIATKTRGLANRIANYQTVILDTRKTTPLLRHLEKYAVRIGGGHNHRMGLYDMIMIKDNHIDFCGGISSAITKTRQYLQQQELSLDIEIEVRNFKELNEVIATGGINRIMLDNFRPADLKKAIEIIDGRYETEASGGITEENIEEYAATGVGFISVGALTHHIKSIDMSLKATTP